MTGRRVLIATHPGIGHLRPLFPVAAALIAAGHAVRFAVAAGFADSVVAEGFDAVPAGLDWDEQHAAASFPELDELTPWERGLFLMRDVFADMAAHAMAADLLAIAGTWQPDLLIRTDYEFGSAVVAERLGLPLLTVSIALPMPAESMLPLVGDQLTYLRSAFGLPPRTAGAVVAGLLSTTYLSFAPPSLLPDRPGLLRMRPSTTTATTGAAAEALPPAVRALAADRPTVFLSLGTVFNDRLEVFDAVLSGLERLPVNVVATVGRTQDPAALGRRPPHVVVARYIPQDALFGRVQLFVTHSPFYTGVCALQAGLPLLMLPQSADQPDHATRFAGLGVGLILRMPDLAGSQLPPQTPMLDAMSVADAAARLLAEPRFRRRAAEVGAEIAALPPVEQAVDRALAALPEPVAAVPPVAPGARAAAAPAARPTATVRR